MFTLALGLLASKSALGVLALIGLGALGSMLTNEQSVDNFVKLGLCQATGQLNPYKRVVAKAVDYTVLPTDGSGTLFTTRGAAAPVTFTLPAVTPNAIGTWFEFAGVADQTFTVSAGAGKGVAFNNAACASLACSTGGQKIGAVIRAFCDGTSWILNGVSLGVTYTVA